MHRSKDSHRNPYNTGPEGNVNYAMPVLDPVPPPTPRPAPEIGRDGFYVVAQRPHTARPGDIRPIAEAKEHDKMAEEYGFYD